MKKLLTFFSFLAISLTIFVTSAFAANTVVVKPNDLALPTDPFTIKESWYFYNDDTNLASTAEVPGKYQFVTGIDNPPNGSGSIKFNVGTGERWNIATNQFAGTSLIDLGDLRFTIYRPSASAGSSDTTLFFNFDVDFDNTAINGYKGRLVYVPSDNGTITEDSWQTWNMNNGSWRWSRYFSNGNMWPDGNTNELRSWSEIVSAFPNAEVLQETFTGQLLIRAGHPGPDGLVGYIDSVVVGGTTFDFEPIIAVTTNKNDCKEGGWKIFNSPAFKNQGDCVSYVVSNENAGKRD